MRTEEEIIDTIETMEPYSDLDGRRRTRLMTLLPYEKAKRWLEEETTEEEWEAEHRAEASLRAEAHRDLEFAWSKCLGHRGISASLMAGVMKDWVWLLCSDGEAQQIEDAPYENYGAPQLALAGELLDLSVKLDEEEQKAASRMAQGLLCREDGCDEGCGS